MGQLERNCGFEQAEFFSWWISRIGMTRIEILVLAPNEDVEIFVLNMLRALLYLATVSSSERVSPEYLKLDYMTNSKAKNRDGE